MMTGFKIFVWKVLINFISNERAISFWGSFFIAFLSIVFFSLSLFFFFTSTSSLSMDSHLSPDSLSVCQYVYIYPSFPSYTRSSSTPGLRLQTQWHLITFLSLSLDTIIILRAWESTTWQDMEIWCPVAKKSKKTCGACRVTLDWVPIEEFNCWSLCCINAAFERRGKNEGRRLSGHSISEMVIKERSETKQLNSATHDLSAHISL